MRRLHHGIHEKHVVGADGFQVRFVNDVKVRTEPRPSTMLHAIGKAGEISLPIFVAWVRPNRNDEITATTAGLMISGSACSCLFLYEKGAFPIQSVRLVCEACL